MGEKAKKMQTLPKRLPRLIILSADKKNYSEVKLSIPKIKKGDGMVSRLDKPWFAYYYFRNPKTGKFDSRSKFKVRGGINKYKNYADRKAAGITLVETLTRLLAEGFNPYKKTIPEGSHINFDPKNRTIKEALLQAVEDRKTNWAKTTYDGINLRVKRFISFGERFGFINDPVSTLHRNHVLEFIKFIKKSGQKGKSVNNFRSALSAVFGQMIQNGDMEFNVIKDIRKEKENPIKNHPFTNHQIAQIKEFLQQNDPGLLDYMRCVAYSFLRTREVVRLQVKGVDLQNNLLTVKTKTDALEKIYIIDQLKSVFEKMNLENYDPEDFVFTDLGHPGPWDGTSEQKRYDHFNRRFRKVRDHFSLGLEYGVYSLRHTFAVNVQDNFIDQGSSEIESLYKLMTITRHSTVEGLRNYLREKRKMLPQDYGSNITIDL